MKRATAALFAFTVLHTLSAHADRVLTEKDWAKFYEPLKIRLTDPGAVDLNAAKTLSPIFNGRTFLIDSFNHPLFSSGTRTVTDTIVTSSTINGVLSNIQTVNSLTTQLTTIGAGVSASGTDASLQSLWVNNRAGYLMSFQGMTQTAAVTQATAEYQACSGTCTDQGMWGHGSYFSIGGTNPFNSSFDHTQTTTTTNTTNTTTSPGPAPTTVVNGNQTVTTTYGTTTTTTTTNTTTTVDQGVATTSIVHNNGSSSFVQDNKQQTTTSTSTTTDSETPYEQKTTTEQKSESQQATRERERKWKTKVAPSVFFNVNYRNQVEQSASYFNSSDKAVLGENSGTVLGKPRVLEMNRQSNGPFKVTRTIGIDAGAGINVTKVYTGSGPLQGLVPHAGILPMIGSTKISERIAITRAELEALESLPVPSTVQELTKWRLGEKLTYMTRGGVMFMAGVTYYNIVGVGVGALAMGTWTTEVQKIGENVVLVKLAKGDLQSISVQTSVGLMASSLAKFQGLENGFSFLFKTDSKEGAEAFSQMLAGNIAMAQELAAKREVVIHVDANETRMSGTMANHSFGLPYLFNWTWGTGKIQVRSDVDFHADGSKSEIQYGVYLEQSQETVLLRILRDRTFGFYGLAYTTKERDGRVTNGTIAQVGYSFSKENATGADLKNAIRDVIRRTGLREELAVKAPSGDDDVGYVSMKFLMSFDRPAIERLLAISAKSPEVFAKVAQGFTDSYLAGQDILNICQSDKYGYADKKEDFARCDREVRSDVAQATSEMLAALNAIRSNPNDRKFVSEQMGYFGRAMLTNALTFQTAFQLVRGYGVTAQYEITGSEFTKYDLTFAWAPRIAQ